MVKKVVRNLKAEETVDMEEKKKFRIWTNGGNEGYEFSTFDEAFKEVFLKQDNEWKGKEISAHCKDCAIVEALEWGDEE